MENIRTWNKKKDYIFNFVYQIEHVISKYISSCLFSCCDDSDELSKVLLIEQLALVAFQIIKPNWIIDLELLKSIWCKKID